MSHAQRNRKQLRSMKLGKESVFIDGGAHKGEELKYLSKIGCEVHSFEVNPVHCRNLKEEYSKYKNIIINHAALWIEDDYIDVYHKKTNELASMSTETCKVDIDKEKSIRVKAIDIATYILSLDKKIDVMKLDIEGGEYKVINHLIETEVIDKIEKIYFEDHNRRMRRNKDGEEWRRERKQVKKLMKAYKNKFESWW